MTFPLNDTQQETPANSPVSGGFQQVETQGNGSASRIVQRPTSESPLLHSIGVAKRFSRRSAHDFNNVIAVMQGFATILQGRLAGDDANCGLAAQIEESANEALRITAWLSSFGHNNPNEIVNLDVNDAVKEFLATVQDEQVRADLKLGEGLPQVVCDERQLLRICECLWQNAVEAMPDGGTVCLETALVEPGELSEKEDCQYVRLSVIDGGEGIEEGIEESIFDPFFTTKTGKERGLGLTMVYDAAQANGGFVEVSSQPGAGTRVDVYLPVQPSSPSGAQESQSPSATGRAQKLLVVDDEQIIHLMIAEILKGQGIEIVGAATGEDALKIFQESAGGISGVILDMTLPGMGGVATFEQLRQVDPSVKVIISTGDPHQPGIRELMDGGAFGMLSKPYSPDHLTEVVQQLFN